MRNKKNTSRFYFLTVSALLVMAIIIAYWSSLKLRGQLEDNSVVEVELENPLPSFRLIDARGRSRSLTYAKPLHVLVFCRWDHLSPTSALRTQWESLADICFRRGIPVTGLIVPNPDGRPDWEPPFQSYEVNSLDQFHKAGVIGVPIIALAGDSGHLVNFWIGKPNLNKMDKIDTLLGSLTSEGTAKGES